MGQPKPSERPDYGLDAPGVVGCFLAFSALGFGLGLTCAVLLHHSRFPWLRFLAPPFFAVGFSFLLTAAGMIWGSKVGKLRLCDKVLDAIPWRGDEQVLDVGCGHGLMLLGAAKRLRQGKATGIDLWQKVDQAGNSRQATWQNVQIEGLNDRVELVDGDARKLPFEQNTFDVVLSSWALHNIYEPEGRAQALTEILRVLKPGGVLVIIDIRHVGEYAKTLESHRVQEITRWGPSFVFAIPSFVLTAQKPG